MQAPPPVIVEILGISGAGKSTLADSLVRTLRDRGVSSAATRRRRSAIPSLKERVFGVRYGLAEALRLAPCFASQASLTGTSAGRFRRGLRGAVWAGAALASGRFMVVVNEPGWMMQFVGLCMQLRMKVDHTICTRLIRNMARPDLLVVLDTSADSSIERMAGRQKGVPRSMKQLDIARLRESLECGRQACERLARAAEASGVATLVLPAADKSADEVLTLTNSAVLPLVEAARRQASREHLA